jgi:hypothetical protein
MSPARPVSFTIQPSASLTSSRSDGSLSKKSSAALALLLVAAIGYLTSCAIVAVGAVSAGFRLVTCILKMPVDQGEHMAASHGPGEHFLAKPVAPYRSPPAATMTTVGSLQN